MLPLFLLIGLLLWLLLLLIGLLLLLIRLLPQLPLLLVMRLLLRLLLLLMRPLLLLMGLPKFELTEQLINPMYLCHHVKSVLTWISLSNLIVKAFLTMVPDKKLLFRNLFASLRGKPVIRITICFESGRSCNAGSAGEKSSSSSSLSWWGWIIKLYSSSKYLYCWHCRCTGTYHWIRGGFLINYREIAS